MFLASRKKVAGAVKPILLGLVGLGLLAGLLWRQLDTREKVQNELGVVLLMPDGLSSQSPQVRMWLDAAQEEGVLLRPMAVSDWVRASSYWHIGLASGVILPDSFHREVSSTTVAQLEAFVSKGGRLMLLQDGGLLDEKGYYPQPSSRLSRLAGVVYGEYGLHQGDISSFEMVEGLAAFMDRLHLPPGRYQPSSSQSINFATPLDWAVNERVRVSSYSHELNRFPVLSTRDAAVGAEPLLTSPQGHVVAQTYRFGQGKTLFVNLPLTHLKQKTDGIFLHGFLRYFAHDLVGQPRLSATPNHMGTLVLNWHNDDGLAIHYLKMLQEAGVFDHGHQSMHFTAGPDVDTEGDGKGMDLRNNAEAQAMVAKLASQGHTIGNHGGWIHNYFGKNANDNNGEEFEIYLDLNNDAVTQASGGKPIREYSAPMGNQPLWAYDWLTKQGSVAYYTTSNIGAAPTRVWLAERRMSGGWGFPVTTNGRIASAEEAYMNKVPPEAFGAWLTALGSFIERERVMRLAYFHPVGATLYIDQLKQFVAQVQGCADQQKCRFLSMTEAAEFLERRIQTTWQVVKKGDGKRLNAHNPAGLQELVWLFPKHSHTRVTVVQGDAEVRESENEFLVHVRSGSQLSLQLMP